LGVVFIGSQPIGHDCLRAILAHGIKVDSVFTFKPDPHESWSVSVDSLAKENNIPLFYHEDLTVNTIKKINPELILVVGYRKIFPNEIIHIPKYGIIGLHASLLPHLRGQAPLNWAIINGDSKAGITMFKMDDGIDTGDIVGQKEINIEITTDIIELKEKISDLAVQLVNEYVPLILKDQAKFLTQPSSGTYGCARIPEDGKIDWTRKTIDIYNLIRAQEPTYASFTFLNSKKLYIKKSELVDDSKKYFGICGQVGMTFKDGSVLVITGDGVIKITRVNFENEEEVEAKTILKSSKIRLG
jgi:methionyl-tRNA formyltransferase